MRRQIHFRQTALEAHQLREVVVEDPLQHPVEAVDGSVGGGGGGRGGGGAEIAEVEDLLDLEADGAFQTTAGVEVIAQEEDQVEDGL